MNEAERDRGRDEPARDSERRIPDHRDRLDHGPGRDLAERDGSRNWADVIQW